MIKLDISEDQYELYDFTESVIQFMGPLKIPITCLWMSGA